MTAIDWKSVAKREFREQRDAARFWHEESDAHQRDLYLIARALGVPLPAECFVSMVDLARFVFERLGVDPNKQAWQYGDLTERKTEGDVRLEQLAARIDTGDSVEKIRFGAVGKWLLRALIAHRREPWRKRLARREEP